MAEDNTQEMPQGKSRRSRVRRTIRCLAIIAAAGAFVLALLLYNPVRTLSSLERVDGFPLYRMQYHGTYLFDFFAKRGVEWPIFRRLYRVVNPDACTSFTASSDPNDVLFSRNFDWTHRACLLLYTDPPGGYASVSMVDLYYLGLDGTSEIPWRKRLPLLVAPHAAIDGMNECGVAIAQNAVPRRQTPKDPNKPTLLNSQIVRLVLDHARDVNEAVALIQRRNVQFVGTPVHFHIADVSGHSVIVEYLDDGIRVVRNDKPWQVSTNFLASEDVKPQCWRYDKANETLSMTQGDLSPSAAMDLLNAVHLDNTVWSVVYDLRRGQMDVALGKDYGHVHRFSLDSKK